jgi:hypothetical protein
MDPTVWIHATRRFFGLTPYAPNESCQICSAPLDEAHESAHCKHQTHNAVVDVFVNYARSVGGLQVQKEVRINALSGRRLNFTIVGLNGANTIGTDVTVPCPLVASNVARAARMTLATALHAGAKKREKYDRMCNNERVQFVDLPIENLSGMPGNVIRFADQLARVKVAKIDGDDDGFDMLAAQQRFIRQQISIAIHRTIGTAMRAAHDKEWARIYAPQREEDEPVVHAGGHD